MAKTDATDARLIAHFCVMMNPEPWRRLEPAQTELKELAVRHQQLISQRVCEKNRLQMPGNVAVRHPGGSRPLQLRERIYQWLLIHIRQLGPVAPHTVHGVAVGGAL